MTDKTITDKSRTPKGFKLSPGNFALNALKGAVIAIGAVLPGISGGALCVIMGIYSRVMSLLAHPFKEIKLQGNINSLIQILNNLISNAIQSYEGVPNKTIDMNISNTEKNLKITITDYGTGIAPEVKDKLFKEIISNKGKNGTGLGLFISYSNLKTQFNGDLKFDSELGKGSTFEIILPI